MSAIAARRAALLLQKAASSIVPAAPVEKLPTTEDASTPNFPQPKPSGSRNTYSKKNSKRERNNRSVQRPKSLRTSPSSNGTRYEPVDRVVVEIDVMETAQDDHDMDEVEAGNELEEGSNEAGESSEVEDGALENAGQDAEPAIPVKETSLGVTESQEQTSDESDFAFDFSEPGSNPTGGRPRKKRRVEVQNEEQLVSTFKPCEGISIYRLSADDVRQIPANTPAKKAVAIILQPEETLVLSGTARIIPVQGHLSVFSTLLSPSTSLTSYPIYAPLTHPLPTLAASSAYASPPSQFSNIKTHLPISMVQNCRPESVVFLLQELDSGLENMPGSAVGLHKVWPEGKGAFGLHGVHPVLRQSQSPVYRHITPPTWTEALRALGELSNPLQDERVDGEYDGEYDEGPVEDRTSPCIALVKGAKRSGKSTFTREVVNRLLHKYERVAYLDTDLGQSEFGMGGTVGLYILEQPLLGPAFSHPTRPLRSHFIGSLTPRLLPEYYISCISQLIDQYRYEVQYPIGTSASSTKISEVVPLVINTQGWVKGLGADLLLQIEHLAEPTHTFTFINQNESIADNQSGRGANDEPAQHFQGEDYGIEPDVQLHGGYGNVFHLAPIPVSPLLSRFTASDMRIMSTISYLHARISDGSVEWDFSSPLARHAPWKVDLGAVFQELYLTGEGTDGIIEDDLPLVLNARLVALVDRVEGTSEEFYKPGRQLPDPSEVNCVGFGLIRSISPDGRTLHLLSPAEPEQLSRVNIMIGGELELPVCGMLDWRGSCNSASVVKSGLFGVQWADVPFLTVGADQGVGMGRRKWRRNIMRKGQGT